MVDNIGPRNTRYVGGERSGIGIGNGIGNGIGLYRTAGARNLASYRNRELS